MITESPSIRLHAPATYRVVREMLLAPGPFHQSEVAAAAGVSKGRVSQVVKSFRTMGYIKRQPDGRYLILEVAAVLLTILPFQRRMSDAHNARIHVRGGKEDVREAIVESGGILCLESALEEQSGYFRAGRVCGYHPKPEELVTGLSPHQGGKLPVDIYNIDLPLDGDVEEDRRTTKWRTLVDLACDGKAYAGKDLLQELWGIALD